MTARPQLPERTPRAKGEPTALDGLLIVQPPKMPEPVLSPRVEQRHDAPGLRITSSGPSPFGPVTKRAGERQVLAYGLPAILLRVNVIDLERHVH